MASDNKTTQYILEVDRVQNDTLVLRDGSMRKILLTSGINFDLKSEDEQNLLIFSFQEFLNSLNFSVQILIHSRKVNIERYLKTVQSFRDAETNTLMRSLMSDYQDFIGEFITKNPIMSKTFFVVVPYDPLTLPGKDVSRGILRFLSRMKKKESRADDAVLSKKIFEDHLKKLDVRVDEVVSGLHRIGFRSIPLTEDEITELFYHFYNPSSVEKERSSQ